MVIHSLALWSRGLFLEYYLKLVWLISDFEVQWFQWFCIYLLEFNVFIYDLLWHFAVDFPGSRWWLAVNHDILGSLNSWIIIPKMKCALLLSWETSLHLTSVMQQWGLHSYLHHALYHLKGLGNGLACGRATHLLLGHQMAPKQFVTSFPDGRKLFGAITNVNVNRISSQRVENWIKLEFFKMCDMKVYFFPSLSYRVFEDLKFSICDWTQNQILSSLCAFGISIMEQGRAYSLRFLQRGGLFQIGLIGHKKTFIWRTPVTGKKPFSGLFFFFPLYVIVHK